MTKTQAEEFLFQNCEIVKIVYKMTFGNCMSFANPRVEHVLNDGGILISCHYDGYDDYDDYCDNPDCPGCEICDEKDSWDFELHIDGLMPGGIFVY